MAGKFEWALPIGTILEGGSFPYEVMEYLGQGGFGITYKVKARVYINNIGLDAFFAIKEYFPTGCWRGEDTTTVLYSKGLEADMKSGLADFITEGERLQKICKLNTNIVNVNEVFRANDTAYYVMEYLDGGDLRQLIKENGSGVSEAKMMSIMRPVAEAVQCLHDNRMLHLDIKPENIVMRRSPEGRPDEPVLIDFGIAVHFDSKGNPTTKNPSTGVSAGYSPKEQYAQVKTFDPRLDIYALSATCFYMLTGKDPVDALNMTSGFVKEELPEDLSELTARAIERGMSIDKSDRQRSVRKFMQDFEAQHSLPVGAVIAGRLCYYMINEVNTENQDYIHYTAAPWNGDPTAASHDSRRTSSVYFDVWEWWLPSFKREGKNVNTGGVPLPHDWWLPHKMSGLTQPGTFIESEVGAVIAELVQQNNTLYCIVRQGWKPSKGGDLWKRLKKPLLITVLALLGGAAVGIGGYYAYKALSKPSAKTAKSNRDDKSDTNHSSDIESLDEENAVIVSNKAFTIEGNTFTYSGPVDEQGLPSGKGECRFADNATYEGEFLNGKMNGEGVYVFSSNDRFEGTLKDDMFFKGKWIPANEPIYFVGDFQGDYPYNGTWYKKSDNSFDHKQVNGKDQ